MWGKQQEDDTIPTQFNKELANLEAEERIIEDKREFGRVRSSLMKYLEAKYGRDVAYRALRRINARISRNYFDGKSLSDLYRHSKRLIKWNHRIS